MNIDIDGVESVRLLAAKFGRMPDDLRKSLRPKLLDAARVVVREAQSNASWSSRIPGAIKAGASVTSSGGALVRVDRKAAPHARPYEGVGLGTDMFRHPVFGNRDVWVSQKTRPFLFPALQSKQDEARSKIAEAVKSATSL